MQREVAQRKGVDLLRRRFSCFHRKLSLHRKACQPQVLQGQVIHILPDDLEVYTILWSEHSVNLIKGLFSFQGAGPGWAMPSKWSCVRGMVVIKGNNHNSGGKCHIATEMAGWGTQRISKGDTGQILQSCYDNDVTNKKKSSNFNDRIQCSWYFLSPYHGHVSLVIVSGLMLSSVVSDSLWPHGL